MSVKGGTVRINLVKQYKMFTLAIDTDVENMTIRLQRERISGLAFDALAKLRRETGLKGEFNYNDKHKAAILPRIVREYSTGFQPFQQLVRNRPSTHVAAEFLRPQAVILKTTLNCRINQLCRIQQALSIGFLPQILEH